MATAGAKKHSKFDKQEVTQGLNPLYTPQLFAKNPAACIDIIAVPGLGSDMTHTWTTKNVHWLKDENMLQKAVPDARISVFGYRSQWYGPDAVQTRISAIADDLLHHIHQDRHGKNSKRPIIFLGHSLGGLVIAKAVSEAKRRPEDYPGIFSCITSCVFLGTPFRGSEAQPFAHLIGMAGETIGLAKYNDLIRSLKAGSIELDDLANDFLGDSRKASIDLICYYETENTMAKPEWDVGKLFKTGVVIASRKSSTFEGYPSHPWARTHSQMNKFEGPKDVQFRDVSGTLKEMVQKSFKLIKLRQDSVRQDLLNDSRADRILEELEVINLRKDLNTIRSIQGTSPSWIQNDQRYQEWKESKAHQNLWISGRPGMGKAKAAISMLDDLNQVASDDRTRDDSPAFAYFFCDEQDREKSKAINVIKTLVWQLLKAKRFLTRHFLADENRGKNPQKGGGAQSIAAFEPNSLPDLWKCLKAALVDPSLGTVYFLVNGLDQIDSESRKEFLSLLTSWQPPVSQDEDGSAPVVKWLFLSVSRPDIQLALHDAARVNLDDGSNSTEQNDALRKLVAEEITTLSHKKGYSRSLEYYAKAYISFRAEGKSNHDWVKLVCLELEYDSSHYNDIRQHLESLPSDLGPMYDQLSQRVLRIQGLEVERSKEILRSLLLVYSPPTLFELAIIADLPEEDRKNEEAIMVHVRRCGAFTQIFDDGGKLRVQLSYNSVRDYLKSKYSDWLSMPSEQIQHGIIALRCFEYVRATVREIELEEAEEHHEEPDEEHDEEAAENQTVASEPEETNEDEKIPTSEPLVYPYTKWIDHALEATPDVVESFGLEEVFWILESEERKQWSTSYSSLNDEEFDVDFTALHIAAYFGYVPLADLLLRNESHRVELGMSDSNGHRPLYWACKRGRMNMVQKLCDEGAEVNEEHDGTTVGLTPLHGAASSGSVEITEYILNKGAIVDVLDEDDGTALYVAVEGEFQPVAQLLLDRGANPSAFGGEEDTPLNSAANNGNLELVKLLISRGADINLDVEYSFGNPLVLASYQGYTEIAQYLLEQGCRFDKISALEKYPLGIAAEEGYPEIVQILLGFDKSPQSHDHALQLAVEANQLDCVKVLVERCPAIQRSDSFAHAARNGFADILSALTNNGITSAILDTALYEAADFQHEDTVRVLLEMGADPNAEGEEYGNALQAAAFDGTEEIMQMLVDRNADVNRVYGEETFGTALQAAAFEGSITNVKLLVERGAAINGPKCGKYGSPLGAACYSGREEVVEYLLLQRADPNAPGGPFTYPIVAATDRGYGAIVKLLVQYHADVNVTGGDDHCTPLINAAMELPKSIVELLYNHGARINDFDDDHDTALLSAASTGDTETVTFLLDKGSDIHNIGKWGGALYRATEAGEPECMKVLLERGIDVNQEGGAMCTSLQAAASFGNIENVNLLLEHGANIHKIGGTYHTALQAAVFSTRLDLVQLLLDKGANVNDQGGKYGSPLHAAVHFSLQETIDILLPLGADVNAVDTATGSVLSVAIRRAPTEIVSLLIEKGADVNARGGKYETALQTSCYMETIEEANILLAHGADPLVEGGYYGNALSAAASVGSEELMELLLSREQKLPPQMLVEALYTAVHYRQAESVKLLLQKGVDVTGKSAQYTSLFDALDTELSEAEIAQTTWDGDDDEEDDDDEEEEDSDEGEEDDDDSSDTSEDSDSEDGEAAEKIEIYEGIKRILTEALDAVKPPSPVEPQQIFELPAYDEPSMPQQRYSTYTANNTQPAQAFNPRQLAYGGPQGIAANSLHQGSSVEMGTSFQNQQPPHPNPYGAPPNQQILPSTYQALNPQDSTTPSRVPDASSFNNSASYQPVPSNQFWQASPSPPSAPDTPPSLQPQPYRPNAPQIYPGKPQLVQRASIPRKQVGSNSTPSPVNQSQYQEVQPTPTPQRPPWNGEQLNAYNNNSVPEALRIARRGPPTDSAPETVPQPLNPAVPMGPAYNNNSQGSEFNNKPGGGPGQDPRWNGSWSTTPENSSSGYTQGHQVHNSISQFNNSYASPTPGSSSIGYTQPPQINNPTPQLPNSHAGPPPGNNSSGYFQGAPASNSASQFHGGYATPGPGNNSGYAQAPQANNHSAQVQAGPSYNPNPGYGQPQGYDQPPMVSRQSSGLPDVTAAALKNKWKQFMS